MLQLAQRTSAPSATRVSISTAVCTVMCSEPAIRAPASGLVVAEALAHRHQAGHLVLGQGDLRAAELGQRQVGNLEVHPGQSCERSVTGQRPTCGRLAMLSERRLAECMPTETGRERSGSSRAGRVM